MIISLNDYISSTDEFEFGSEKLAADEPERENILIVDDEEIVRRFHINCLSPQYHCYEAASAEEAVEILLDKQISLVISDWVMGGMSGVTLLRKIVGSFPDIPVLMISGIDHPERALDAMRFGAFDYLIKPCKPELILNTAVRALDRRKQIIESRRYQIDLEMQNLELRRFQAAISNSSLSAE